MGTNGGPTSLSHGHFWLLDGGRRVGARRLQETRSPHHLCGTRRAHVSPLRQLTCPIAAPSGGARWPACRATARDRTALSGPPISVRSSICSHFCSQETKYERLDTDIGGHTMPAEQEIWTTTDLCI